MIVHVFNSSSVSGPERLVLPALSTLGGGVTIVNLAEDRIERLRESDPLSDYCRTLHLAYRTVRVKKRWDRDAIGQLKKLFDELRPQLVHAHATKASIYVMEAARHRTPRFPLVSTHHGVHGLPDWKTRLYDWVYRKRYLPSYDRVLAVSSDDFAFLRRSGINDKRLRLHLNGVDGRRVAGTERAGESQRIRILWLSEESQPNRLFLFGVVGRMSAEKDHARTLNVLAELEKAPSRQEWKCLIFGVGQLENKLRDQAASLGLEKRIKWMGYRDGVGSELAGLDLLLSFSKAEGLPINVIEAGWAATPVMATSVGGINDLIPDDTYGVRVPLDEVPKKTAGRITALLSGEEPVQLRKLGQRFQDRVAQEFTQGKWMGRLGEIYAELGVELAV